MSRENVEVVYRMASAVGQRDVAAFLDVTDPAVEWHTSLSVISEGGAYHGHEGVHQYIRDLDEAFESFEVTLDDVFALGEVAMAVGRVDYRGKASGVEQTEQFGWIVRFHESQVIYLRAFRDPEQALAAVGLRE
jgi:ketosteroid isomerase-like protein